MPRRHAHRLATTVFVVLARLVSQLGLAGYVCPQPRQSAVEMPTLDMASGEPCAGMAMGMENELALDKDQPVLCQQHCVNAPQSFDPVQLPAVSLPAVVLALVVPSLLAAGTSEAAASAEAGQARPPPNPLFLSTLRLRV